MANDSANKDNIKGIWFEKEYVRTYPYDAQEITKNVLEQILPYMNIDRVDNL